MKYVSGIRPTGKIHLGNYLGAIKQWKTLPKDKSVFFVADLHSKKDHELTHKTIQSLFKLGLVDNVFVESHFIHEIYEIYHEISQMIGVGQLERMTQYKDKKKTEQATLSLLAYPVLMTADIFFFGDGEPTLVPVGNDQTQHIQFARDVHDILAHNDSGYTFSYTKPEALISEYPRIMSLADGTKKMSKSDSNNDGCIFLDDSRDEIFRKIKKAKTSMNITDDTPEMKNLMTIYKALGGQNNHTKCKDFKEELAELICIEFKK